jgi:hypothetical protein
MNQNSIQKEIKSRLGILTIKTDFATWSKSVKEG